MKKDFKFETNSIHKGQDPDPQTGAVIPSISVSTTFLQNSPGNPVSKYDYTRASNPTRESLETCIASLEEAKRAFCLSSGCAATSLVLHLLKSGDHILASDDLYGGTVRSFDSVYNQFNINTTYADLTDLDQIETLIQKNTKLVWIETPSNPLLKMIDIQNLSEKLKKRDILLCVDNTFLTPFFQKPLCLGADIVIHSATKYLGGHSDILGGVIAVNSDEIADKLDFLLKSVGSVLSPNESYLLLRSIKTLAVRMEKHEKNALKIAEFLQTKDQVEKVIYPGLKDYSQKEISQKQTQGSGGMLSFYLKADFSKVEIFLKKLNLIFLAESLGGVESLINHPGRMTHAGLSDERKKKLGINDSLLRFSVGLENSEDLIWDLEQALDF